MSAKGGARSAKAKTAAPKGARGKGAAKPPADPSPLAEPGTPRVGASTAGIPEPDAPTAGTRAPAGARVRAIDFSQPTKFTTEIRRRIAAAVERFCDALAGRLTAELRAEVQLTVAQFDQHTWAATKAQLPADAVAVAVHAPAIERQMLLSVEQPWLLQALECLLGGAAEHAPRSRHLTDVDWTLARGLMQGVVAELSLAWADLGGPALQCGEIDLDADAGVLAAVGEPTFTVALASTIDSQPAALSLLIPWTAVEPIAERIHGDGADGLSGNARDPYALRRGLASAQVLLRTEVGSTQMGIERMLELSPGALVQLRGHAEDGVSLFAEGVALGRGRPGRAGAHRAVKLQELNDSPVRTDRFAKLGRAELLRARSQAARAKQTTEGRAILRSIFVRVWAELGRTHMSLRDALELAPGAVVELDQPVDAPVELYVNGLCFAHGRLVVTADGGWGVQVSELL